MSRMPGEIDALWNGPFSWPDYEEQNGLPGTPRCPGVYLQTFEYLSGYMIYGAGITRRTVITRFKEHSRSFMNGKYTILEPSEAERGVRKEIWHGWGYARTHRDLFEANKLEFQQAARQMLARLRIFVADVGTEDRVLERIEASIMNMLYRQPSPYCDIPDRGMKLTPRRTDEPGMLMISHSRVTIHGLPTNLEI
uniref:GIY-YIG nuclease family protein n=1 Tax=Chlorobium phaeovibrioides (strain DSM 265 / 1930) TaxID=290318 RepID=A4SCB1_CHLPM